MQLTYYIRELLLTWIIFTFVDYIKDKNTQENMSYFN